MPPTRGDKAIAAFDATREGIGVELRAQLVDAGQVTVRLVVMSCQP